ncbi:F-box/FBD/LRR-repeat protein At1g13570-like [Rutidosis leptorrhynchoides]|uniref:F-box/FBD/LRR-repeat protein At1g13570-like n=1 Tax=Rutidosis leptorrhynchoides TaxID=125765 RepID=UPI003A991084
MEPVHGSSLKRLNSASEDRISRMPDDVLTDIMDHLPIEDAVRTSILSRNWRYKWHSLTQLRLNLGKHSCCIERNISTILLSLNGPVTNFDLCVKHYYVSDVVDISSWVLFLSRKGIKKLTIFNFYQTLELPNHLFSCSELKHMSLYKCCFHLPTNFRGFPNLLTLDLSHVVFKSGTYGKFISQCPLLKSLTIFVSFRTIGETIKLMEIANVERLNVLSLPFYMLENITTTACVFHLLGYFPQLQELHLDFRTCKFLADGDKDKLFFSPSLKVVSLSVVDFSNTIMLSFIVELICCSPNLKTLRITEGIKELYFIVLIYL